MRALDARETLPPALAELLAAPVGSMRVDLGSGLQAVREYDQVWLEHGPIDGRGELFVLEGPVGGDAGVRKLPLFLRVVFGGPGQRHFGDALFAERVDGRVLGDPKEPG